MEDFARDAFGAGVAVFAGYAFFRASYYRRYLMEHWRTDRFALHILGYAIGFVFCGAFIAEVIPDWTPPFFESILESVRRLGITATTVNAIAVALLLGVLDNLRVLYLMRDDIAVRSVSASHLGIRLLRMAAVARYVRKSNDAALRTLFRAVILEKRIMITLTTRKVYVGDPVLHELDPSNDLTSIRIIPFASGSRDASTKEVKLSTWYSEMDSDIERISAEIPNRNKADPLLSTIYKLKVHGEQTAMIDIEDLGIVIQWKDVESLTLFDENIYAWFQYKTHGRR
jgi:hypothetical protein